MIHEIKLTKEEYDEYMSLKNNFDEAVEKELKELGEDRSWRKNARMITIGFFIGVFIGVLFGLAYAYGGL